MFGVTGLAQCCTRLYADIYTKQFLYYNNIFIATICCVRSVVGLIQDQSSTLYTRRHGFSLYVITGLCRLHYRYYCFVAKYCFWYLLLRIVLQSSNVFGNELALIMQKPCLNSDSIWVRMMCVMNQPFRSLLNDF